MTLIKIIVCMAFVIALNSNPTLAQVSNLPEYRAQSPEYVYFQYSFSGSLDAQINQIWLKTAVERYKQDGNTFSAQAVKDLKTLHHNLLKRKRLLEGEDNPLSNTGNVVQDMGELVAIALEVDPRLRVAGQLISPSVRAVSKASKIILESFDRITNPILSARDRDEVRQLTFGLHSTFDSLFKDTHNFAMHDPNFSSLVNSILNPYGYHLDPSDPMAPFRNPSVLQSQQVDGIYQKVAELFSRDEITGTHQITDEIVSEIRNIFEKELAEQSEKLNAIASNISKITKYTDEQKAKQDLNERFADMNENYATSMAGLGAVVSILSVIDPASAKYTSAVGDASINIAHKIATLNFKIANNIKIRPKDILNFSFDIVSIVFNLLGALFGGPSDLEIILKELDRIHQNLAMMIENFRNEAIARLEIIDLRLQNIERALGILISDVKEMKIATRKIIDQNLLNLKTTVYQGNLQQAYFNRKNTEQVYSELYKCKHILNIEKFIECVINISNFGLNNSSFFISDDLQVSDLSDQVEAVNSTQDFRIFSSSLGQIIRHNSFWRALLGLDSFHFQVSGKKLFSQTPVQPQIWMFISESLIYFLTQNEKHLLKSKADSDNFDEILAITIDSIDSLISKGKYINNALESHRSNEGGERSIFKQLAILLNNSMNKMKNLSLEFNKELTKQAHLAGKNLDGTDFLIDFSQNIDAQELPKTLKTSKIDCFKSKKLGIFFDINERLELKGPPGYHLDFDPEKLLPLIPREFLLAEQAGLGLIRLCITDIYSHSHTNEVQDIHHLSVRWHANQEESKVPSKTYGKLILRLEIDFVPTSNDEKAILISSFDLLSDQSVLLYTNTFERSQAIEQQLSKLSKETPYPPSATTAFWLNTLKNRILPETPKHLYEEFFDTDIKEIKGGMIRKAPYNPSSSFGYAENDHIDDRHKIDIGRWNTKMNRRLKNSDDKNADALLILSLWHHKDEEKKTFGFKYYLENIDKMDWPKVSAGIRGEMIRNQIRVKEGNKETPSLTQERPSPDQKMESQAAAIAQIRDLIQTRFNEYKDYHRMFLLGSLPDSFSKSGLPDLYREEFQHYLNLHSILFSYFQLIYPNTLYDHEQLLFQLFDKEGMLTSLSLDHYLREKLANSISEPDETIMWDTFKNRLDKLLTFLPSHTTDLGDEPYNPAVDRHLNIDSTVQLLEFTRSNYLEKMLD